LQINIDISKGKDDNVDAHFVFRVIVYFLIIFKSM